MALRWGRGRETGRGVRAELHMVVASPAPARTPLGLLERDQGGAHRRARGAGLRWEGARAFTPTHSAIAAGSAAE